MEYLASAAANLSTNNEFAGPLPQIYLQDEVMEMVFDNFGKYNAMLDFSD